jgi:hypothetical protein
MAESPDESDTDRWTVPGSPVGAATVTYRKRSARASATTSTTVAKLSKTYCARTLVHSPGRPSAAGYSLSVR